MSTRGERESLKIPIERIENEILRKMGDQVLQNGPINVSFSRRTDWKALIEKLFDDFLLVLIVKLLVMFVTI